MITAAQLKTVTDALEAQTSVRDGNANDLGYWRRIALALEEGSGVVNAANDTRLGWMTRAALAAEAAWGGSGAEENSSEAGLLKRIVDAMEIDAGVGTGSLANRLAIAAPSAGFFATGASLALDFVSGKYRLGSTVTNDVSTLSGYSHAAAPTITPDVGFVVAAGVNMTLLNSIAAPTGDFTLVVLALSPTADAVYYVAATLDDEFTSNANAVEMSRNNAGNHQRVRGLVGSATVLDNAAGTGTPAVTTPAIATGAPMRFGAYRESGLLKPILYGTKRTGTPAHSLTTLDSLRVGHRMVGGAANSPFTGGTIQKIFLYPRVLSDAEIAAL